ncbi:ribosomal protein S12 methylthiotransferase RimO [Anaerosporomusa subterranea]|uniref:Ribosomal protein uS12 methylthiotransferase RimO n=1 Tax=Anaerosporomusa subterranea TaxID=1794912 RepID=A0A154BT78_ANASB|nr:30S ribosomal protein S12 methylthiotransferase RimO [Anaerosporomusa subterranea]KYZ77131.1 ribosomal protein S12 methylthiotransferase RimO [Anaerosporomusa subterranea]
MKVGFVSLGCAKNLVDTEVMLGLLDQGGYVITDQPEDAEVLIVNTCSFIDSAKEESISVILQMGDYKKHGKCRCLVVAGCLGQRYRDELLNELPEVDAILGTSAWGRIIEAIEAVQAGSRVLFIDEMTSIYDDKSPRIRTTPNYSAYIKIADGCSNCCSYCVIPRVRGNFRSRPIESVVAEAKNLVSRGVKEINLIAQDTTSYGRDRTGQSKLTELLRELVAIEGEFWIRLLYCYPNYFTDELIELIANEPKICKYIDLPLQHAHDDVLLAMNRRDSRQDIETLLKKIRSTIAGVAIRTTFIVGFPGETEEQFRSLRDFMAEQRFDHVGVFSYSQEEDTPAGAMTEQIPDEVRQARYHELMALQSQISESINRGLEGMTVRVLVEGQVEGETTLIGRSYREAPDVDGRVYIEGGADVARDVGCFVNAKIIQGFAYDLVAEPAEE